MATTKTRVPGPFKDIAGHEERVHSRADETVDAVDVWCRCGKVFSAYSSSSAPTGSTGSKMLVIARSSHRKHARDSQKGTK